MSRRQQLLASALLALVAMSWWLARMASQEGVLLEPQERQADYFLTGVKEQVYDEQGNLLRVLDAAAMRYYPAEEVTELEQPRMVLHGRAGEEWRARAQQGAFHDGGAELLLRGAVVVERPAHLTRPPLRIESAWLRVYPEQERVETTAEVQLFSEESWLRADGLHGWFGEGGRIRLLSNVRGYYAVHATGGDRDTRMGCPDDDCPPPRE